MSMITRVGQPPLPIVVGASNHRLLVASGSEVSPGASQESSFATVRHKRGTGIDQRSFPKLLGKFPELKRVLDKTNWPTVKKQTFLRPISEVLGEHPIVGWDSVAGVIDAMMEEDWNPFQGSQLLVDMILSGHISNFSDFKDTMEAAKKAGWNSQERYYFIKMAASRFKQYGNFAKAIEGIVKLGGGPKRGINFLAHLDRATQTLHYPGRTPGAFYRVCIYLPKAAMALQNTPLDFERKTKFLLLLVEQAGCYFQAALECLNTAIDGMEKTPWDWETKQVFLIAISGVPWRTNYYKSPWLEEYIFQRVGDYLAAMPKELLEGELDDAIDYTLHLWKGI